MALKKCSAHECVHSARYVDVPMFKFPRDLDRCAVWVRNSGNEKLLQGPSTSLCIKRHLCCNHFEDSQFFDKFHRRLKRSAVPTIFSCAPISEEKMSKFPIKDDCTLSGRMILGNGSAHNMLYNFCNKYNVFPLTCPRVSNNGAESSKSIQQTEVIKINISKKLPIESASLDGSQKLKDKAENVNSHPSVMQIPCDPVVDDMNSMVPESMSITYIEGPWSNPDSENQPFAIQLFGSSGAEILQEGVIGMKTDGQFSCDQTQDSIEPVKVKEYFHHSGSEPLQCSPKLSSAFVNTNHQTEAIHCSEPSVPSYKNTCSDEHFQEIMESIKVELLKNGDNQEWHCLLNESSPDHADTVSEISVQGCDKVPSEIGKFLSSSRTEKHFVLKSKQLANGAQNTRRKKMELSRRGTSSASKMNPQKRERSNSHSSEAQKSNKKISKGKSELT